MSHYHHLSIIERENLLYFLSQGYSIRKIAKILGRSPSTISRELRKNLDSKNEYHPSTAQQNYQKRRKVCGRKRKLVADPKLRRTIHFLLGYLYWSPEQIAARLEMEGTGKISFSTIYRSLDNGSLRASLHYFLRKKYKTFGKASKKRRKCFVHTIEERPIEAAERSEVGHWEGDTIIGHGSKACIVTLVDRKSRFLVAGKADTKQVSDVVPVIIKQFKGIDLSKIKTITFDQGPEFTQPELIEEALDTSVYFAHPHSPWERPTNENTNGLLRQFYSKEFPLGGVDQSDVDAVVAKLNMRPRKCLNWKTPYEAFHNQLLHFT